MKYKGKITAIAITAILIIAGLYTLAFVQEAKAATIATQTFVIPYNGETAYTIVITDRANGNVVDASDGTSEADTAWNDGEIAGTRHAISGHWTFTVVRNLQVKNPVMNYYNIAAASLDKDDLPYRSASLYDSKENLTYSSTNRMYQNAIVTIPVNATN